jgi:3',5'-nucleoside bisphosphate phosphatase
VIDLHLHTTASDGRSTPEALVAEAAAAGIRTMAVTDHDTVAAIRAVQISARAASVDVVPGIEITAVLDGQDVHVLGYFLDATDAALLEFLARQRADRRRRLGEIVDRLARLGVPVDADALAINAGRETGKAVGRPLVAAALVAAGYVKDIAEAFEKYLAEGRPGFVGRRGAEPAEVVAIIARAGGLAAVAHPGKLRRDDIIAPLARDGMPAIEVFHPDHTDEDVRRYETMARGLGLLMTGGSDYHGRGSGRADGFGRIGLPREHFERLVARAHGAGRP